MVEEQKLDQEQINQLKESITNQIKENTNFSQEQKNQFIEKINSLDNDGFIQFLKKQGIIKDQEESPQKKETPQQEGKCVFCSIVFGDIPSRKIAENEKAIAVLEINPFSKGHSLIIPKEHITSKENIPEEAKNLAIEVSEKIKKELSPKEIKFESKNMFGHEVLNIIPLYENQKKEELQQKQASKEELGELEEKLKTEKDEDKETQGENEEEANEKEKSPEIIDEKDYWLPKRIP